MNKTFSYIRIVRKILIGITFAVALWEVFLESALPQPFPNHGYYTYYLLIPILLLLLGEALVAGNRKTVVERLWLALTAVAVVHSLTAAILSEHNPPFCNHCGREVLCIYAVPWLSLQLAVQRKQPKCFKRTWEMFILTAVVLAIIVRTVYLLVNGESLFSFNIPGSVEAICTYGFLVWFLAGSVIGGCAWFFRQMMETIREFRGEA